MSGYISNGSMPSPPEFMYQSCTSPSLSGSFTFLAINSESAGISKVLDYNVGCNLMVAILDDSSMTTTALYSISASEFHRLYNAACRISLDIVVIGSRANGTAKATSDWDYIIEKLNNRKWKKIKNSIHGAKTINTPRMIDIVRLPVDSSKPHIRVTPSLLLNKLLGYGKIEYFVS